MEIIKVKVKTGQKTKKVERIDGFFIVQLKEKPEKGKANKELISIIANHFNISSSKVRIIRGLKSKEKILKIYN